MPVVDEESLKTLIKFGKVTKTTDDTEQFPVMQVTYSGKVADLMRGMQYGLISQPVPGNDLCLIWNIMGDEENRVGMPLSTTQRLKGMKDGEVALYNELTKGFIKLSEDGILRIKVKGVEIQTSDPGSFKINGINVSETHKHGGSPTAPIGGISDTQVPIP